MATRPNTRLTQPFRRATTGAGRSWLRRPVATALLAAALLTGVGALTVHAVQESLSDLLTTQLQSLLNADVKMLGLWFRNEQQFVQSWAEAPDVRHGTRELLALSRARTDFRAALQASAALASLDETLAEATDQGDLRGYGVIDPSGVVLAARRPELIGNRLTAPFLGLLADAFAGRAVVTKPYRGPISAALHNPKPLMFSAAPIVDDAGELGAVLVFWIDPAEDFSRILAIANFGDSGETYAFDENGRLLSTSRFENQLIELGLIPDGDYRGSILNVQIRDPGGDLRAGFEPGVPLAARPLTEMAAAAVAGHDGIDLLGYRNYLGVTVIGAWRWQPELNLGVATEMSRAEAFRLLRPLVLAFIGLIGLLLVAAVVLVLSSFAVNRLQRRVMEAEQLGQYTLVEKIGEGGMAVVYKARHAMLHRPTAVKLLKPDIVNEENIARFEREVQLTSELTHPNTIEIYDFGRTPQGAFYYAMEYLDGISLAELIELDGAVGSARTVHILKQVCGSLLEAHENGLIHRDIKPPNIMLCRRVGQGDVVKVLDFGLVKDTAVGAPQLTALNVLAGTPLYIAPERLRQPEIQDPRTDLYAVGVVGFNLLTGRDLFTGAGAMELCQQALHAEPPHAKDCVDHEIPVELDRLIHACLAKDPAQRPQTAARLIDVLDRVAARPVWSRTDAQRWWQEKSPQIQRVIEARA